MTPSNIEYSQTFERQLHDSFRYLAKQIGQKAAKDLLESFLDGFEARVLAHPKSAPLCEETASLGMTNYYDFVDSKCQMRVIYRIDKTKGAIYALLFLSTRKSIRQALIQYCLRQE